MTSKNFIIRCSNCRWAIMSTGLSEDLKEFNEIETCTTCGVPRKFKCQKCSGTMKMIRVKGNQ